MNALSTPPHFFLRLHRGAVAWILSWWRLLNFSVMMLTVAAMPATYSRDNRRIVAHHLVRDTLPNLAWFGVLSALVSLVLIRIVVATSQSYGLSRYALDLLVRVLTLELIPLCAAAFVALRTTLPTGLEFAQSRKASAGNSLQELRADFFPRVAAGIFAVWMLAAVCCVATLILAYLSMYGFTPYALPGYTRAVGQVFNPAVTLILVLKIVFFSFAVGLIPMASSFYYGGSLRAKVTHGLSDMVRLFAVILLIEVASLMGNYY
ncbi:MAG: ABC transporter permease [Duganella sp.]|jgi:phospholipid/cholesterol/gamma-HCH transport system permease protein